MGFPNTRVKVNRGVNRDMTHGMTRRGNRGRSPIRNEPLVSNPQSGASCNSRRNSRKVVFSARPPGSGARVSGGRDDGS